MKVSRRDFFKLSFGTVFGLLIGSMFKGVKPLFAVTETKIVKVTETMYKLGDKVP